MTLEELLAVAEVVEKLTIRYRDQEAAHKAALTEIRASFNARTSADEKIIEGLRAEIIRVNEAHGRTKVENDGLRDELTAQRDAFTAEVRRIRRELCGGCDALRAEVERLMAQTPEQHPVKVGEWVRRTKLPGDQSPVGIVKQVTSIRCDGDSYGFADGDFWSVDNCEPCDPPQTVPVPKRHPVVVGGYLRRLTGFNTTPAGEVARVTLVDDGDPSQMEYEVVRPNGEKGRWSAKGCEPCDPPATHDTPEGRSVAESVIRDGRKTEPVAEEIKVGDVVKVRSASGDNTAKSDIGKIGEVRELDSQDGTVLLSGGAGWVSRCDIRKVTT